MGASKINGFAALQWGDNLLTGFTLAGVGFNFNGLFKVLRFTSTFVNWVACSLFTTLTGSGVSRVASSCLTIPPQLPKLPVIEAHTAAFGHGVGMNCGRICFTLLGPVASHVIP